MPLPEDDPRLSRCGFAKLQGEGMEVYVRKYCIYLGRKSKSSNLDVVLGEHRNISRKHACIRYNFQRGVFELLVLGKNGATVTSGMRGVLHTPASPPTELKSRDMIQMGDKKFYFLLPKDTARFNSAAASKQQKQQQQQQQQQKRSCNRQSPGRVPALPVNGQPDLCFVASIRPDKSMSMPEESYRNAWGSIDCHEQETDALQTRLSYAERFKQGSQVSKTSPAVVDRTAHKRKLSDLIPDNQDLVYAHASTRGVQGTELYHSEGVA